MEKQLLYLLDYDLAITEDEIIANFEPFLSQYTFDSPVASASSPVMPPTPVTPVTPIEHIGPIRTTQTPRRHRRTASRGSHTFVAPPLDRSGSSSSLESDDMPLTPEQSSSPPSPRKAQGSGKGRSVSTQVVIQHPPAVYEAPHAGSYNMPRSVTSSIVVKSVTNTPVKEGFLNRFLRSDRKRRPATRVEEEEEEMVAALSWAAI